MKKLVIAVIGFLAPLLVICQVQRLALLPSSMKFAEDVVPSLCIDFFNDPPSIGGTSYKNFKSFDGSDVNVGRGSIDVDDFKGVRLPGTSHNQPIFMSPTDNLGDISQAYKEFIKGKINQYKNAGKLTKEKLDDLQDEIWSYDVLNRLGYINPQEKVMDGYSNARMKFSRDFFGDETASIEDILDFGQALEIYKEPAADRIVNIRIFRNENNNSFVAFNKIGPPIYKGNDVTALATQLAPRVNNGDVVLIDEFENELRETAFMKNLQRKLRISYSKDVTVCTGAERYLWEPRTHTIQQQFRADRIVQTQENGQNVYKASMKTRTEDEIDDYYATTIEGSSNNRNLLTNFFNTFSTRIRNLSNRIALSRLNRQIKSQVMSSMNLSNADYLDLVLISEAEYKVLVRIRKGRITIINGYASR
jgi:hypothetical protein